MSGFRRLIGDESGMTLMETVIAMGILGVIIGPIAGSMFLGLITTNGTRDRIVDSAAVQLVSSYFPGDVQSAGGNGTGTGVFISGSDGCPTSFSGATDSALLRMRWRDPSDTSKYTTVVYFSRSSPTVGLTLHRAQCTTGEAEDTTLLVQHLKASGGFVVTCDGSTSCPAKPRSVEVALTTFNPDSNSHGYKESTHLFSATRRADS
jgi:hypothetical protein